jgi:hypothetical protein
LFPGLHTLRIHDRYITNTTPPMYNGPQRPIAAPTTIDSITSEILNECRCISVEQPRARIACFFDSVKNLSLPLIEIDARTPWIHRIVRFTALREMCLIFYTGASPRSCKIYQDMMNNNKAETVNVTFAKSPLLQCAQDTIQIPHTAQTVRIVCDDTTSVAPRTTTTTSDIHIHARTAKTTQPDNEARRIFNRMLKGSACVYVKIDKPKHTLVCERN